MAAVIGKLDAIEGLVHFKAADNYEAVFSMRVEIKEMGHRSSRLLGDGDQTIDEMRMDLVVTKNGVSVGFKGEQLGQ